MLAGCNGPRGGVRDTRRARPRRIVERTIRECIFGTQYGVASIISRLLRAASVTHLGWKPPLRIVSPTLRTFLSLSSSPLSSPEPSGPPRRYVPSAPMLGLAGAVKAKESAAALAAIIDVPRYKGGDVADCCCEHAQYIRRRYKQLTKILASRSKAAPSPQ